MNIPDEYWTTEVPTEPGWYAVKWDDGGVSFEPMELPCAWADWHRGCHFCRLAPAAEVERLKAENEKLRDRNDSLVREGDWLCITMDAKLHGQPCDPDKAMEAWRKVRQK